MKTETNPSSTTHHPTNGSGLLDELAELLKRSVVLPEWAAEGLALWILHTYAFELRDVTAYLGIESQKNAAARPPC